MVPGTAGVAELLLNYRLLIRYSAATGECLMQTKQTKIGLSAQDRVNWQTAAIVLARSEGSAVTQLPRSSQKIVASCEQ